LARTTRFVFREAAPVARRDVGQDDVELTAGEPPGQHRGGERRQLGEAGAGGDDPGGCRWRQPGFLAQPGAGGDGALGFVGAGGLEGSHAEGDLGVEQVSGGEGGPQLVGLDVDVESLDCFHECIHRSQQGT
jgi:hypothetical protein